MLVALLALSFPLFQSPTPAPVIRINQLGYLPDAPKIAVFCALERASLTDFVVRQESGRVVSTARATPAKAFGPCESIYRLDFSSLRVPGSYRIEAGGV